MVRLHPASAKKWLGRASVQGRTFPKSHDSFRYFEKKDHRKQSRRESTGLTSRNIASKDPPEHSPIDDCSWLVF